jgi:hypothetical protein
MDRLSSFANYNGVFSDFRVVNLIFSPFAAAQSNHAPRGFGVAAGMPRTGSFAKSKL